MIADSHPTPDLLGRATLVLSEHATLRNTVDALCKRRASLVDQSGPPSADLLAAVTGFGAQLLAHFAAEERAEYFGAIEAESPELRGLVPELLEDHRAMRAILRDIQASPTTQQFLQHFSQLLERFTAHERREAAMLERLFGAAAGRST